MTTTYLSRVEQSVEDVASVFEAETYKIFKPLLWIAFDFYNLLLMTIALKRQIRNILRNCRNLLGTFNNVSLNFVRLAE